MRGGEDLGMGDNVNNVRIMRDGGKVKACLEEQLVRGEVTIADIERERWTGELGHSQVG